LLVNGFFDLKQSIPLRWAFSKSSFEISIFEILFEPPRAFDALIPLIFAFSQTVVPSDDQTFSAEAFWLFELTSGDNFCSSFKCIFAVEPFVVLRKVFSLPIPRRNFLVGLSWLYVLGSWKLGRGEYCCPQK
jgi:hypothetical protein